MEILVKNGNASYYLREEKERSLDERRKWIIVEDAALNMWSLPKKHRGCINLINKDFIFFNIIKYIEQV